ncbi:MAG: EAL domain-containing protein [Thermodesulfobacteriota bacterium]|nr:EAL domain-containing protein [Thermodesulfobacteriota bacterium]
MKSGGIIGDERFQWYLEAVADANREWMVTIDRVPFIIGRDRDCDLKLTDKWISRHHSEIRRSGDHLWIRDLGSTNGTFVNQKKIEQAELLEPGDNISIGTFKFSLKCFESNSAEAVEETCFLSDVFDYPDYMESRLRDLILAKNIIPYFQPILKMPDLTVTGYEILGRIADEVLPSDTAELFDMADWFGCGTDLSALFRETGVEVGLQLPGNPLLFVNAAPFEINQMNVLLDSMKKVRKTAPDHKIVLEINERAANNPSEIGRLRDALTPLGTALAFDDFGVGQTRLVELAKAPPDFLKFDISLIREIHLAPKRLHQMVSTFVKAAGDLGIATLAEGVECVEEAETCQQLGFNFAQGFYYGRPLPIHEILADYSAG